MQENRGLTMRYIDNILQPGETVAFTTTLHWIVYLPAIGLWFLAFIALTPSVAQWGRSRYWRQLFARWWARR